LTEPVGGGGRAIFQKRLEQESHVPPRDVDGVVENDPGKKGGEEAIKGTLADATATKAFSSGHVIVREDGSARSRRGSRHPEEPHEVAAGQSTRT
jgi:hypothetical protein